MQRNALVGLIASLVIVLGVGLVIAWDWSGPSQMETAAGVYTDPHGFLEAPAISSPAPVQGRIAIGVYMDPLGFLAIPVTSPPAPAQVRIVKGVYADPNGFLSIPVTSPPAPAPEANMTTQSEAQAA